MKTVNGGRSSKHGPTEPMTIEEVRALSSFEDWDGSQIAELLSAVQTYVSVVYGVWARQQKELVEGDQDLTSNQHQIISLAPHHKAA
jgi:hypothetical protein